MPTTPQSQRRWPEPDELHEQLLEAALHLLAEGGRAEFSLRRVAETVGVAASAASHRFGDRAGLIMEACDAALSRERDELDRFARALPALPPSMEIIAPVLIEWLDTRVRRNRTQARLTCELVLMGYREPGALRFGEPLQALYAEFLGRLCPGLSEDGRALAALYLIAETPHALVLADDSLFRLLSRETTRRVASMALGVAADEPAFWVRWISAQPPRAFTSGLAGGTKGRIAAAVAALIAAEGAHAVTHRGVAKAATVSLSSLVHHFGAREELIRAGAHVLFDPANMQALPAAAGFDLAVYALADRSLAPLVAEVRMRQGGEGPAPGVQELARLVGCARELISTRP